MLPNHSPLVIAEQFGTLASLYPGRIDLGLGRAPGTDMLTARALRRDIATSARAVPAGRAGAAELLRAAEPGNAFARYQAPASKCRSGCWLEPVQRAACRDARPAVRIRSHFAPDR